MTQFVGIIISVGSEMRLYSLKEIAPPGSSKRCVRMQHTPEDEIELKTKRTRVKAGQRLINFWSP